MAQKVKVLLLCDLHEEEVEGQETVQFGLDGNAYEVDVCAMHAQELRDGLTSFVEHSRKVGGRGVRARGRGRGPSSRERSAEIRSWARAQGINVSERGRIPSWIVEKYQAAH